MACNSCNRSLFNTLTFPDFVSNSCCNPCCSGSVLGTGSCGCHSCGCGNCGCNGCGCSICARRRDRDRDCDCDRDCGCV